MGEDQLLPLDAYLQSIEVNDNTVRDGGVQREVVCGTQGDVISAEAVRGIMGNLNAQMSELSKKLEAASPKPSTGFEMIEPECQITNLIPVMEITNTPITTPESVTFKREGKGEIFPLPFESSETEITTSPVFNIGNSVSVSSFLPVTSTMTYITQPMTTNANVHLVLVPDEGEDMWHTYNLISEGDRLRASTIRKVQQESATGSSSSSRIRTTLTIQVETTDFDIGGCLLRVKGRNVQENKYIKMGAYHTIDLEPNRKFTLFKEEWDSVSLERVENACDPAKHADLAAVIMQEGLAFLCLITSAMTVDRAKIEVNIPKKGKGDDTQRKKASAKFFDMVLAAILRHLNFDIIKAVILASP
ncbi:Protein pelota, partial [Armadillidium nasatum]